MKRTKRRIVIICTTCTFVCTHAAHADWDRHRSTEVSTYELQRTHSDNDKHIADRLLALPLIPGLQQEFDQNANPGEGGITGIAGNSNS